MQPSLQPDDISSVVFGTDISALDTLHGTAANLAVWRRHLPALVAHELTLWTQRLESSFNEVVRPREVDVASLGDGLSAAARAWLTRDIRALLTCFADITRSRRVRLRFGPVRDDRCRKFRVDYMRWRLVTTYAGPATMWIANEHVRRAVLLDPPACPEEANRLILRSGGRINQARAGDVLLMKGELSGSPGLVHRSPPMDNAGCGRLVLVMSSVEGGASPVQPAV